MALATKTAQRYDLPVLIAGQEIWGADRFEIRYPYTGEVVGSAPRLTRDDVVRALEYARDTTITLSRHERAQLLFRIADRLQEDEEAFARLITLLPSSRGSR
jgi:aldehyde dehydrogenase (NAD+)